MLPVGDFILHAMQWTGQDPVPMFAVFDGWSPVSGIVPPELAPVIDAVNADPASQALLTGDAPAAERMAELRAESRRSTSTCRVPDSGSPQGSTSPIPTIGERPDVVLDRIRGCLDHDADAAGRRAAAVEAELREAVPADERADFDDLLAEARHVYRLRDERGLYSDAAAVGLLRLALIELGRRMFAAGRINFMYDTLDLRSRRDRRAPRRRRVTDGRRTLGPGCRP